MPILEQRFTDINGSDHLLSVIMDGLKEWLVHQEYEGLNTVTDFSEGSMNYLLLCFAASMKFDLTEYGDGLIRHAFLATAQGEFLEMLAARNGIFRIQGEYATTMLRLSIPEARITDSVVGAGTEFGTDDLIIYNLLEDTVIPAGTTIVYARVQCQEPGIIGNVKVGSIINIFTDLNIPLSVFNESDLTDGRDVESDDSLRERAKDSAAAVGTDLWVENVARTIVSDALCYDTSSTSKTLIFKPSGGVTLQDVEDLFQEKMYRTRHNIIIQEATPFAVIDETKSINLIIKDGFVPETVLNILTTKITSYVDKIRLGGLFKTMCIKYLCESTEGVLYAELTGYIDIDLTNEQYPIITGDLQINTEGE
jgi:hypothetical protein